MEFCAIGIIAIGFSVGTSEIVALTHLVPSAFWKYLLIASKKDQTTNIK